MCLMHTASVFPEDTVFLSGKACCCRTAESVLLHYQYVRSHNGTVFPPWGASFQTAFLCTYILSTASEATRSFPNATGRFLAREWQRGIIKVCADILYVRKMCIPSAKLAYEISRLVWQGVGVKISDARLMQGLRSSGTVPAEPQGCAVCVSKWHFWWMLSADSLLARQRNWVKVKTC